MSKKELDSWLDDHPMVPYLVAIAIGTIISVSFLAYLATH